MTSTGILVYIEMNGTVISPVSRQLIGEAYRLSLIVKQPIYGVCVGSQADQLPVLLAGYPLHTVYLYQTKESPPKRQAADGGSADFRADFYEEVVSKAIDQLQPAIVLIGGTYEGRSFAPRLAVRYGTGLTADCTELSFNQDHCLVQTRPAFGGNLMASILTRNTRPQFATVRPNVMPMIEPCFLHEINFIRAEIKHKAAGMEILEIEEHKYRDDISSYKLLIVAGRGVKKKEDLTLLRQLAKILGGGLASSRALVEKGWMDSKEQIGISGNTVSPECLITFGVSGTVQFMAGMKGARNIIAINTDPKAPIFKIAHYPICSDLYEVLPDLLDRLKK